jgi:two-component system, cell cycle response regulator
MTSPSIISTQDLDGLLSVAAAIVSPTGTLTAANAGFLRLLGAGSDKRIGTKVGRSFVQPSFAALVGASPATTGEVYRGLLTIGDYAGTSRTLRGRVWRISEGIRLLAEHDIEELESVANSMNDMGNDSLLTQRMLGVENIGLKRREAQALETSLTDALTGVGNRRRLDQALAAEITRVTRTDQPLSAAMADLDHFKKINDRFGHTVGDKVLACFGRLLLAQTRPTDIVVRYGGEEFLVLMPHTDLGRAMDVAERIRRALEREHIAALPGAVTSSFGVAERIVGEDAEAFLRRVDAALYEAKELGRNRVVSA